MIVIINNTVVISIAKLVTTVYMEGNIRDGSRISSWGGEHLNNLRRAEGGANIFGVFRVKNHDFTPKKNHIFSNIRRGGRRMSPPPWIRPCCLHK